MGAKKAPPKSHDNLAQRRRSPLITPTDLRSNASMDIAGGMNAILADVFVLYLKTKNFHWHGATNVVSVRVEPQRRLGLVMRSLREPVCDHTRLTTGSLALISPSHVLLADFASPERLSQRQECVHRGGRLPRNYEIPMCPRSIPCRTSPHVQRNRS
jgi:hypothetical protein